MAARMLVWGSLLLLFTAPTPAAAGPRVVITVVSETGHGVKSRILRKVGPNESESATDDNGTKTFEPLSCSGDVSFKIRPFNPLYVYPTGWQDCQSEMVITLRPVGYASDLSSILTDPPNFAEYASSPSMVGEIAMRQTRLRLAVKSGSWGDIAFNANELSAMARSVSKPEVANIYSALAIETGARVIADADEQSELKPLLARNGTFFTETSTANSVLRSFQLDQSLARTGKWDYKTFQAIRELDSSTTTQESGPP